MTAEPQPWMRDAAEKIASEYARRSLHRRVPSIYDIAALIATAHASAPSASAAEGGEDADDNA